VSVRRAVDSATGVGGVDSPGTPFGCPQPTHTALDKPSACPHPLGQLLRSCPHCPQPEYGDGIFHSEGRQGRTPLPVAGGHFYWAAG
jgi:hypothetical protein